MHITCVPEEKPFAYSMQHFSIGASSEADMHTRVLMFASHVVPIRDADFFCKMSLLSNSPG